MTLPDLRAELRRLIVDAMLEAHSEVVQLSHALLHAHFRYPTVKEFKESGMPSFSEGSGPIDYTSVVGATGAPFTRLDEESLPKYQAFLDAFVKSPEIRDHVLGGHDWGEFADIIVKSNATRMTGSLLERLMHAELPVSPETIGELYEPLERGLFEEDRPVEVIVPLICVACDVDAFDLSEDVRLERMDEQLQVARMALHSWGPVQDVVLGAATHALIVSGGMSTRVPFHQREADDLPRDKVNRALQALRVASDAAFGHAQLIVRPVGWASRYVTTLPPLEYALVERRYPPSVDNFGWLRPPARISEQAVVKARDVYERLDSAPLRIQQAARRIDRAQMREDLDDAVVDYCIGLESLLDDTTHTETTHKCALRAGTVLASSDGMRADVVFDVVKKAYALRSAIVHGRPEKDIEKLRTLTIDGQELSTSLFVRFILHMLVMAMLENPGWQDPKAIDRVMLDSVPAAGRPTATDNDQPPEPEQLA